MKRKTWITIAVLALLLVCLFFGIRRAMAGNMAFSDGGEVVANNDNFIVDTDANELRAPTIVATFGQDNDGLRSDEIICNTAVDIPSSSAYDNMGYGCRRAGTSHVFQVTAYGESIARDVAAVPTSASKMVAFVGSPNDETGGTLCFAAGMQCVTTVDFGGQAEADCNSTHQTYFFAACRKAS